MTGALRSAGGASFNTTEPEVVTWPATSNKSFTDTGRPFLHFVQRTSIDGQPRHTETGYWRMPNPDAVEVVIALPSGQAERGSGTCRTDDDGALVVHTDASVQNTPTAKRVDRVVRSVRVEGDRMHYEVFMEAVGQGLALHLSSELTRQPSGA